MITYLFIGVVLCTIGVIMDLISIKRKGFDGDIFDYARSEFYSKTKNDPEAQKWNIPDSFIYLGFLIMIICWPIALVGYVYLCKRKY